MANDFYSMGDEEGGLLPGASVDTVWGRYESGLHSALDHLVGYGAIDHETWLRVLVPFAVGTLCRAPAFEDESLAVSLHDGPDGELAFRRTPADVNFARFMEVPRLTAPVMSCRWVVLHLPDGAPDITNDIGFAPMLAPDNVLPGVAIPIARGAVLALLPVKGRTVLMRDHGRWITPIEHRNLTLASARDFGIRFARQAREFIIGPDKDSVEVLAEELAVDEGCASFFSATGLRHVIMRDLIYEWHRVLTAAGKDRLVAGPQQDFDWRVCERGWFPPPILGLGEDTPTGVTYNERTEQLLFEMPDNVLDEWAFERRPPGKRKPLPRGRWWRRKSPG